VRRPGSRPGADILEARMRPGERRRRVPLQRYTSRMSATRPGGQRLLRRLRLMSQTQSSPSAPPARAPSATSSSARSSLRRSPATQKCAAAARQPNNISRMRSIRTHTASQSVSRRPTAAERKQLYGKRSRQADIDGLLEKGVIRELTAAYCAYRDCFSHKECVRIL
jgi:hypothetical protein